MQDEILMRAKVVPKSENKITINLEAPSVEAKLGAAIFIASMGAGNSGVRPKAQLMHPLREFSDADVQRESARFLGSVLTALLQVLPRPQIDKILKDQAESVFFAE
jgi:hypothetical protein